MNKALGILLFVDSLVLLAGAMIGPIYALFVDKIGGDLLTASITFAVFSIVSGIATFLIGKFEDLMKEQELALGGGYFLSGLAYIGYLLVQSPFHLFLTQVLLGIGTALLKPAFDALMSKHLDQNRAASQWGAWESMNSVTLGIGAVIGGIIVINFGFPTLFVTMATLCFTSALFIFLMPRRVL